MDRRRFLARASTLAATSALAGPAAALASHPPPAPAPARPPNLVLVIADDVSPAYLSCCGGPTPTPHLDALARRGVLLRSAHAVSPLCNPSRYAILTGLYPERNDGQVAATPPAEPCCIRQSTLLTEADPCVARPLRAAGYLTGYVGKWHGNFELGPREAFAPDGDPDDPATIARLRALNTRQAAAVRAYTGFDRVLSLSVGNLDAGGPRLRGLGDHNLEWQTAGALDFLDEAAAAGRPFFLHLANTIPHSPDVFRALDQDPRYTQAGRLDAPPRGHPPRATVRDRLRAAGIPLAGHIASINAGMILLDDQVGALTARLQEMGALDDTLFVVVGDHSIFGKGTPYVPGTHVPALAAWPRGFAAGRSLATPVSLVDLAPTFLDAAGAPPATRAGLDGRSLLPLLRGETTDHPAPFVELGWTRALIRDGYQYVAFRYPETVLRPLADGTLAALPDHQGQTPGTFGQLNLPFKPAYHDPDQLYDLAADPFCRTNLAADPAHAARLASLRRDLFAITRTGARPFPEDAPPEMAGPRYAALAAAAAEAARQRRPEEARTDAERRFNLNLVHDPASAAA